MDKRLQDALCHMIQHEGPVSVYVHDLLFRGGGWRYEIVLLPSKEAADKARKADKGEIA